MISFTQDMMFRSRICFISSVDTMKWVDSNVYRLLQFSFGDVESALHEDVFTNIKKLL